MQTLHRSPDRLVGERTALINQLRAILLERGLIVPQRKHKLEQYLAALMEEHEGRGLSPRMRTLVADMRNHATKNESKALFRPISESVRIFP